MPGTGEMVEYGEGTLWTFDWNGYRFGILICNDLWATPGYTMPNPYLLEITANGSTIHCALYKFGYC
jgi:predicted amidohydrolase